MESRLRFRLWFVVPACWRRSQPLRTDMSAEEKDLVIIGGGVAGYVAAIKAGQEGMKVGWLHRKRLVLSQTHS